MDWRTQSAMMSTGTTSMAAMFNVKSFQIVADSSLTSIKHEFEAKFVESLHPYEEMARKHNDPLAKACRCGDIESLERDLKKVNIDLVKSLARLAEIAAERGHVQLIKHLVDKTRNVLANEGRNLGAIDLGNALQAASYSGHVDVVQYLVDSGHVRVDAYDKQGNSSLHIAAGRGHLAVVEELCRRSRQPLAYLNNAGFAPLHLAVIYKRTNVVEFLLEEEGEVPCSPTQMTKRGSTILHIACEKSKLDMVDFLITQTVLGQNLVAEDADGYRPIHIATIKSCNNVVKYLAEKMVSSGHCPNGKGSCGWTPLHCAAETDNLELVQFFSGMDNFSEKENVGRGNLSPLHIAALGGKKQVLEFLLKNNRFPAASFCSVFVLSNSLHLAAFRGHVSCCQLLIDDYNLDPLVATGTGYTSIHLAAGAGNLSVLEYLVKIKDHSPNVTSRITNVSPLHVAAAAGKLKVLEWLLSTDKCNPNLQMSLNKVTALHLAVMEGNFEAVKLIAAHRACDINRKAILGMTPLGFAEKGNICWELIKNGATPFPKLGQLSSEFRFLHSWVPVLPSVRLCVVGHSRAGKTSLVQALQKEGKWLAKAITNVELHTAGIIPVEFESQNFGRVTVYDFAGHKEYYASHEALLKKSKAVHPIFLLVVDLNQPDAEVRESVQYWKAFIKNATKSSDKVTQIVVVGSHLDQMSSAQQKEKLQVLSPLTEEDNIQFVTMDCRKPTSAGMSQLRKCLNQLCAPLRSSLSVHRHCHALASFLEFVRRRNPCVACSLRDIRKDMERYGVPITDFLHELQDLVSSLSDAGYLLYLRNNKEVDDSWVIFDQKTILEKVHGYQKTIEDKLQIDRAKCSGILNLKQIKKLFDVPGLNIYALVHYLLHMEFCYKIKDARVLHMLKLNETLGQLDTHHFLFPDLLLDHPMGDAMFPSTSQDCCLFGWCLRCRNPDNYITSRFVQLFLPTIAFDLSLSTPIVAGDSEVELTQLNTCLWKRGLSWTSNNVNCTIKLADDHSIMVICHCKKGFEMELVYQRTRILKKVYTMTRQYFDESFKMEEFIISPDSLLTVLRSQQASLAQESVEPPLFFDKQIKVCSVVDVRNILFNPEALTPGHHCINLCRLHDLEYRGMGQINVDDLLHFEPFSLVKGTHLPQMSSQEVLTECWMREGIAEFSGERWKTLAKVLEATSAVINSCSKEATPIDSCMKLYLEHLQGRYTYSALKTEFDRYSIFFGRTLEEVKKTGFNLKLPTGSS